jgi:hypothetical protein
MRNLRSNLGSMVFSPTKFPNPVHSDALGQRRLVDLVASGEQVKVLTVRVGVLLDDPGTLLVDALAFELLPEVLHRVQDLRERLSDRGGQQEQLLRHALGEDESLLVHQQGSAPYAREPTAGRADDLARHWMGSLLTSVRASLKPLVIWLRYRGATEWIPTAEAVPVFW